MLRTSILLLLIWLACPGSGQAAPLGFDQARQLLHERSNALKAASANVESKRETMESLKLLHGPTISAQAFELWGETRIDVSKSISTSQGSMPVSLEENYNFSGPRAAVTGTLPIFTGGRIPAEQKASKFAVDEASARRRNLGVDLDAELIGKYFGLQLAISVEKLRKDMLEQQDRELARAVSFEREGMISPVERMGVQVARDAAAREHLKARDNVRTARLELGRLLLEDDPGTPATPLFVLTRPLSPLEGWVNLATNNNPQIAIVEAKIRQAEQGVDLSRSAWSPQVFAFGQYSLIRHYQTAIEPTWLAGLGVNLTIWDSRDRLAGFRSARASLREAKAARAEAVNQVRTGAETAWLNTQNAREQYNLTASTVALARENLRLKSRGFGEGLYTALDVTEARDQLLAAEVGRRVAAYEFVVNYAMLHAIAGNMDDFMNACNKKEVILER